MKKLGLVLAALLATSAMAWANDIAWFINWGAYTHDASDLVTEESGAILDNYDVLWQLIYAGPNNKIDPIDLTNVNGGFVATGDDGDDEVLDFRNLSLNDSGVFDHYLFLPENVPYSEAVYKLDSYTYDADNPYYVYQRIYESQAPVEGTYYYESELVKLGTDYAAGTEMFGLGPQESGIQATLQVQGSGNVPEPATMSLLGLGALAMVLRRKLRK